MKKYIKILLSIIIVNIALFVCLEVYCLKINTHIKNLDTELYIIDEEVNINEQ